MSKSQFELKAMRAVWGVWETFQKLWFDLLDDFDEGVDVIRYLITPEASEDLKAVVSLAIEKYRQSIKYIIDCDAQPFVPEGWSLDDKDHIKGGKFEWDSSKIDLYLDEGQKNSHHINGYKLRRFLTNKKILNACILDFLLAHPELIPDAWKRVCVCFWGTIYRDQDGRLCVRYLSWNGRGWFWGYTKLNGGFGSFAAAAVCEDMDMAA